MTINLDSKLKGIPKIYVLTLDERPDRQEYTEKQYEYWGITNYTKVSGSEFQYSTYDQWKHLVILNCPFNNRNILKKNQYNNKINYQSKLKQHITEIAMSLSYMSIIKNWVETTTDNYMMLMEDDYDLSFIEYWHFNWEYLMNNIPHDWDCIQLSFENGNIIPCYLHPIISGHGTGASLINRNYAEKLLRLYYVDGKYDFSKKICNSKCLNDPNITVDYFLGHSGKTYCIPLISINRHIGSYAEKFLRQDCPDWEFTNKAYNKWWKKLRDAYTLEEFFTYGKYNDRIITRNEPDLNLYD
jgi:hypothetical protein